MDVPGLWRGFCDPPDDARPRVWWHWMDGNVDPEGIVADLSGDSADRVRALVLTDVCDVARVRINGADLGVLWAAPWRVETRGAFRAGRNVVEIEVANAWMNRLIAEAGEPTGELFAPATAVYEPDAPVRPSGLTGPVRLEFAEGPGGEAHPRN